MKKIIFFCFFNLQMVGVVQAQIGEVATEDIIIEKEKEIVLPVADKLYLPVETPDFRDENFKVNIDIGKPNFTIQPFAPQLEPEENPNIENKKSYQNYLKAGYGSFGSPLINGFVGHQKDRFNVGGWIYHESFAKGAVRNKESASGLTKLDVFSDILLQNWTIRPFVSGQLDVFRYYGYGDGDSRISKKGNSLYRFSVGSKIEETYQNKWSVLLYPTFHFTNNRLATKINQNSENYFNFLGNSSYQIDSSFSVGIDFELGLIQYKSGSSTKRNFVKTKPWVGFKRKDFLVKAGFAVANANDKITSKIKNYFYPNIALEWSGIQNWLLFGSISGYLNPVTYSSLSYENVFLDDSLNMANENIKFTSQLGIKGNIIPTLSLESSFNISSEQYVSFKIPSKGDSAKFSLFVNQNAILILDWFTSITFSPNNNTQVQFKTNVMRYNLDSLPHPWHKPTLLLSLDWYQKYSSKFSSRISMLTQSGIKAPKPITNEAKELKPIVDLSLEINYKISDHFGAFTQMQNILSKEYERYLNYPTRGFSFHIGGIYRF